jgi:hypothetical protein
MEVTTMKITRRFWVEFVGSIAIAFFTVQPAQAEGVRFDDEILMDRKVHSVFEQYANMCRKRDSKPKSGMAGLITYLAELGMKIDRVWCGLSTYGYPDNPADMIVLEMEIPKERKVQYYIQFERVNRKTQSVAEIGQLEYNWEVIANEQGKSETIPAAKRSGWVASARYQIYLKGD